MPVSDEVLNGMQAWLNAQKDKKPASQGDIDALSEKFTTTFDSHGKKIDSIKTLLGEHIADDGAHGARKGAAE